MLSVGSVVYLNEGRVKIVIMNRYPLVESENKKIYFDYMSSKFPEGLDPKQTIYFNEENIDSIVFEGYQDDEEKRYQLVLQELVENSEYEKGIVSSILRNK
ncbi:DUF4176 domain-containing protein [Listeria welshimeri]|uniref:DUF4176 domain-containing protein n=1 Tax=Listeria welshimeri TaxID=1643 RepID=UPI001629779B|nr:DUF4176 domain-containing protein [Listeria welshimeri]MBC1948961.1 DUF4176 domain-containing protein [Listeria welshimeri]MBF2565566.1 DUF4176 domain-containing protein [Listeria welshimeri]